MLPRFRKINTTSGFTIIELLVVVSIISLLSSIVLVTVDTARDKARLATVKANIRTLFIEAELYYSTNKNYAPNSYTGSCGVVGGFLTSPQAAEAVKQIANLSRLDVTSQNFYCNVNPTTWSLTLDISNLTNNSEVLCASTIDGRIIIFNNSNENSNDTPPQLYIASNQCVTPQ